MSTETDTDADAGLRPVVGERRRSLVSVGVLLSILGLVAIAFPLLVEISLSLVFGALLVVGAIFHVASAFSTPGWRGSVVQVALGLIYAAAGIVLMANPVLELVALTPLLAAFFLAEGLVLVAMSFAVRAEPNWEWNVFSGLISLLLAALIWGGFPSTADWAIGLLFGINLLTTGLGLVFLGRGAGEPTAEAAEAPA